MSAGDGRFRGALALMVASGFAGLGYQLVWTQQCALWLGHEAASVLAVITAFFGGLALGAWLAGRATRLRWPPLRWYAACELATAAWGAVLLFALAPIGLAVARAAGASPAPFAHWALAFGATTLVLLPATVAMGATLPLMQAVLPRLANARQSIAALYAANTAGAVLGTLAVTFLLAPRFGFRVTAAVCVAANLGCAFVAWRLAREVREPLRRATFAATDAPLPWALFVTGFLGIGYEVVVVRVLSQATEQTVYTFALLLAVYLVGSAGGATAWHALRRRAFVPWLLPVTALACVLGAGSLYAADPVREAVHASLGTTQAAALAAETALAVLAFGLPSLAMGALFGALAEEASDAGVRFGRGLAVNLAGAALAPPVLGVALIPLLGPKGCLAAICAGYCATGALRGERGSRAGWVGAAVVLATALLVPALAFVDRPPGSRVLSYRDGVMASVSVVEDAQGVARLRIDNRQQEGSSSTLRVDGRQAWLPLLLHPSPRTVLFLGLGTGMTSGAAAEDAGLQVQAVELLPEVVAAASSFDATLAPGATARRRVQVSDARRYVLAATSRYDVIVADNFHPARSGSGSLYTVEHFRAVRERLAPGGLFCQWLPLHQLDLATLRSIVASYLAVWPDAHAVLANNGLDTPVLGLAGWQGESRYDAETTQARVAHAAPARGTAWYGLDDAYAVLGSLVAGPASLQRFARGAPLNTDDRPVVAYGAPRITYAPDSLPRDRLLDLLPQLSLDAREVFGDRADDVALARIAAYWRARDRFLVVGRDVRPTADVRAMLAQVGAPLLEILRLSPDFRPAAEPLMRMADALERVDPQAAGVLRTRIAASVDR